MERDKLRDTEIALTRGDVELLFVLWKESLCEEEGWQIRACITDNLEELCRLTGLRSVCSFKELLEVYDRRELQCLADEGEFREIITFAMYRGTRNVNLLIDVVLADGVSDRNAGKLLYYIIRKLGILNSRIGTYVDKYRKQPYLTLYDVETNYMGITKEFLSGLSQEIIQHKDLEIAFQVYIHSYTGSPTEGLFTFWGDFSNDFLNRLENYAKTQGVTLFETNTTEESDSDTNSKQSATIH